MVKCGQYCRKKPVKNAQKNLKAITNGQYGENGQYDKNG